MQQLRRRGSRRRMDSFEWAANLLQHFSNCCTRCLSSLPLLRRLQRVVWPLLALRWRSSGKHSMLLHVASMADVARSMHMQLSFAVSESSAAVFARRFACLVDSCEETRRDERGSYTAACTDQRSIKQHERQRCTAVHTHSYLHLTCCVCRRIQLCSGCRRGRRSFQPASCSVGNVRALWLHAASMPGGRAHMPCMQLLLNERCRRKGREGGDFAGIDTPNVM